ncbi:hypothetical protein QOZ80_4BG0359220 [Eleusine coracana subsp. coracana]|nr:hypothetical protein QOZ80_4BG0359220 [Eleusine coracana subsp. coracana]
MEYNSGGAGPSHNHMMGDDGSYHLVCINCRYADDYSLEDEEDGFFSCRQCYAIHPIQVTSADPTNEFIPTNTIASRRIRTQPTIPAPNNKLRRNPAASNNRRPTQAAAAFDDDEPSEPRDFAIDDAGDGPEELASRIRLRYVCGMQLILQQQLEVLMERFHVGALICDFAGTIWLRWVHASMVFDEMWARQVLEEYEAEGRRRRIFGLLVFAISRTFDIYDDMNVSRSCADDNKPDEAAAGEQEDAVADDAMGEQEEDETLSGRRDRRKVEFAFLRSLRKMLPVYSTLSVSFLACHVAREAVLPTDIHKWAIEGKIPYIAAFTKVDELLEGPSSSMQGCSLDARQLFRPVRVLGPWQLETHAGSIALRIGLRLPSVNFYEIARRFCMELALPPDDRIIRHACRIYEWALPAELWLSANPAAIPTRVCVMSILIVALRILYNINGHGMWEVSLR